jgi:hypothetical protein
VKEVHAELTPYLIDEKAHEPRALARVYQQEDARFEVHPSQRQGPKPRPRDRPQVLSVDLGQPFPKKKERKASAAEGYVPVSAPTDAAGSQRGSL